MFKPSKTVIFGLAVGLGGLMVSLTPLGLDVEERLGLDLMFFLRGARPAPAEIVIVTMDKTSADHLKLPQNPEKWPREYHMRVLNALAEAGARVIVFDILFGDARDMPGDVAFADAIARAQNVVLSASLISQKLPVDTPEQPLKSSLNLEKVMGPIPLLAQSAMAVAPFPLPKVPVKVSQYWTFKTSAGDLPTLPATAFQVFSLVAYEELIASLNSHGVNHENRLPENREAVMAGRGVEKVTRELRNVFQNYPGLSAGIREMIEQNVAPASDPAADKQKKRLLKALVNMYSRPASQYLCFYGPPATIPTVSYHRVLQFSEHSSPGVAAGSTGIDWRDKAVFIGASERLRPEQQDGFYTVFSQPDGVDLSGVEIAATAFANLLEDRPVRPAQTWVHIIVMLSCGMLFVACAYLLPPLFAVAAVIGLMLVYFLFAQYQFNTNAYWLPIVIPALFQLPLGFIGALLMRYSGVNKERRNIRKAFGYYLPDHEVDRLAQDITHLGVGSRAVFGTCLFTDVENYSALAEGMDPRELSALMNRYYEALFEPVRQHGGMVSDVIGDAMLAIWATPHRDANLRHKACLAALAAAAAIDQFNRDAGSVALPTRMGMHSGRMQLGSIGAGDHYEYRAVGEVVNTASRIEGLNRLLGTRILLSREVLTRLKGFQTRPLGKFLLKGKTRSVDIFELMGEESQLDQRFLDLSDLFSRGLETFYKRSWAEAIGYFNRSIGVFQGDGPSAFYISQCEKFQRHPPQSGWDGLITIDRK